MNISLPVNSVIPSGGPLDGQCLPLGEQGVPGIIWLLGQISGAQSVLEIGSRGGNNLRCLAAACQPNAKLRSIELVDHDGKLDATMTWLREQGFDADFFIGSSQSPKAVQWAHDQLKEGLFDF